MPIPTYSHKPRSETEIEESGIKEILKNYFGSWVFLCASIYVRISFVNQIVVYKTRASNVFFFFLVELCVSADLYRMN